MFTARLFIAALCLFLLLSCSKKDSQPDEISKLLDGTWNVVSYTYNDQDRTEALLGYTFIFTSDKKITAIKQDTSIIGTWISDYTPREGEGPLAPGGELYIQFKFSSHVAAFVDISKRWKPYIVGNDATLLTFDHGIGLNLLKN
jgi:hypothetical protein